jgi:hypothetical protein
MFNVISPPGLLLFYFFFSMLKSQSNAIEQKYSEDKCLYLNNECPLSCSWVAPANLALPNSST